MNFVAYRIIFVEPSVVVQELGDLRLFDSDLDLGPCILQVRAKAIESMDNGTRIIFEEFPCCANGCINI